MTTQTRPALSRDHLQVIAGLARGDSPAQIARRLSFSFDTVKGRIKEISWATGVRGAAAIVNWGYENGVLDALRPEHRLPDALVDLSKRDIEVLALMAQGLTTQQIARETGQSFAQVKTVIARIYTGLSASSRHHAVALAWQQGLLGPTAGEVAA